MSSEYGLNIQVPTQAYGDLPTGGVFYNISLRNFTIINSVILILFVVTYLLVYFLHTTKNWVDGKNCVAPIGEFTVEPGVLVNDPLEACPESTFNNTDQCIFSNVASLLDATRICNSKAQICSRFVYNTESRRMTIVSLQSPPSNSSSPNDNVYTRQSNVTFRTGGVTPGENPVPTPTDTPAIQETAPDPTTTIVSALGLA